MFSSPYYPLSLETDVGDMEGEKGEEEEEGGGDILDGKFS